jgi:hypothetical protein
VTVASTGAYVGDATNFGSKGFKTYHIEGTWEIKDGVLTDTVTNHSDPKARLPFISSERIIRFSTNELVVRYEYDASNFVETLFMKENDN